MIAYIVRRLFLMVPTLFGIILVTFIFVHLAPGDPSSLKVQMSSSGSAASAETIVKRTREMYGLDKPLYAQFGNWIKRAAMLDFGISYTDHRKVLDKIADALPITILLNLISILIIYIISVPVGVYSAIRPKGLVDRLSTVVFLGLYSLPSFWVAVMLIFVFGGGDYLNWFPIIGITSDGINSMPLHVIIANVCWHLVLPVTCLVYGGFAFLSRFVRSSFLEVAKHNYMLAARARGLSEYRVVIKHGLKNAIIPIITIMSTLLPALFGGSVIIERIFSIPGMGRLAFESVLARDYPVIMAISLISATATLIGILISDILYAVVDPRISFGDLNER